MKEEKITENWKAIEDARDEIRNMTGDQSGDFDHIISFSEESHGSHLVLSFNWHQTNRRGEKQKKQESMKVIIRFCPFTGLPLYQEQQNEN